VLHGKLVLCSGVCFSVAR